jgi:hypothetical protein
MVHGEEVATISYSGYPDLELNFATDGTTITFTHPHDQNPPAGASFFYQWSINLLDWYDCNGVDGPPGGATVRVITETVDMTTTVAAGASEPMNSLFLCTGAILEQ